MVALNSTVHITGNGPGALKSLMANLFGTKRQAITKYLNNIFNSEELAEKSVCSILERTAADGLKKVLWFKNYW